MDNHNRDYFPGLWNQDHNTGAPNGTGEKNRSPKKYSLGFLLSMLCIVAAVSILLTYTLTAASQRNHYTQILQEQERIISELRESQGVSDSDFAKLELLAAIYAKYSYYAGDKTEEELLDATLKAYAEATGDLYAEYYTREEYEALWEESNGDYEGIGVSVIQTVLEIEGYEYQVFQVIAIYENAPAFNSGLQVGDFIYAMKDGDHYQTISAVGGYTKAIAMIRGEAGTQAQFAVFRPEGDTYQSLEFSITRGAFESQSVRYYTKDNDPTTGVVHISSFDMTTPHQFKEAVQALLDKGVDHFVFDLRNNPGGDLMSIKAVLTYFLQEDDLILSAIDRDGTVVTSYVAEPMDLTGNYEACNVAKEEVGMYADLDIAVLCNGNTASAAEVFVATMRDYGMARIVGETTFGKGIMQSYFSLSAFNANFTGYAKMTTYAYVTKCGVTYHDIGIEPHVQASLSEEAKQYNIYVLPQALDDQLQAAFAQFQ